MLALLLPLLLTDTAHGPQPYWQQRVAYDISASLDEPSGVLSGGERIRYVNQSPDTLRTFSLHLYLNAFRPGSRWADEDSVEGNRRFNDLKDPDFGFNHVRRRRIMGQPVDADIPVRAGQHHRALRPAAPAASGRLDEVEHATGTPGPRRCRAGRGGRAAGSISRSGIPRW